MTSKVTPPLKFKAKKGVKMGFLGLSAYRMIYHPGRKKNHGYTWSYAGSAWLHAS